jgi:surface antigen
VAAFLASPLFGRVASTVPTTVTATAPVVSSQGVSCQTVTQTITISGQAVRAAAVVCRQPDGNYRIVPTQSAASTGNISPRP